MNITIHIHRTTDRLPDAAAAVQRAAGGPGGRLLRRQRDNRRGGPQDWPARDLDREARVSVQPHRYAVGAG